VKLTSIQTRRRGPGWIVRAGARRRGAKGARKLPGALYKLMLNCLPTASPCSPRWQITSALPNGVTNVRNFAGQTLHPIENGMEHLDRIKVAWLRDRQESRLDGLSPLWRENIGRQRTWRCRTISIDGADDTLKATKRETSRQDVCPYVHSLPPCQQLQLLLPLCALLERVHRLLEPSARPTDSVNNRGPAKHFF